MKKAKVMDPVVKDIMNQIVGLRLQIKELKKQLLNYKKKESSDQVSFIVKFD